MDLEATSFIPVNHDLTNLPPLISKLDQLDLTGKTVFTEFEEVEKMKIPFYRELSLYLQGRGAKEIHEVGQEKLTERAVIIWEKIESVMTLIALLQGKRNSVRLLEKTKRWTAVEAYFRNPNIAKLLRTSNADYAIIGAGHVPNIQKRLRRLVA